MRTAAVLIAATLGVSACATREPPAMPATDAGAPAPVAGLDWRLSEDGDGARLAFGSEASDDLRLALDCQASERGRLQLTTLAAEPEPDIHLESGGDTERYAAAAEPAAIGEGQLLTAEARTSDPVFQRFRRLGWIARWQGDERATYAGHPDAMSRIERFFVVCG